MVSDEKMIESTIERMSSVKTEPLSSSGMILESVRPRGPIKPKLEMLSEESKQSNKTKVSNEYMEPEESNKFKESKEYMEPEDAVPREMELECSSCLINEQMKEGNYELVSKVARSWYFGILVFWNYDPVSKVAHFCCFGILEL